MKRIVIIRANDDAPPDIANGRDAFELDFTAANERGIRMGWGKINAIEFWMDSTLVGTVLF